VRVFVDEGAPMASLLVRLAAPEQPEQVAAAANVPPDYLAPAAGQLPAGHRPPGRAVARPLPGLVEPLSQRELEVLGLLATGRSNQQIAQELVVALDTAKSTSAGSWTSSVRPTAPRRSPAPGSCSYSGRSGRSTPPMARSCMSGRAAGLPKRYLRWAPSGDGATPSHR